MKKKLSLGNVNAKGNCKLIEHEYRIHCNRQTYPALSGHSRINYIRLSSRQRFLRQVLLRNMPVRQFPLLIKSQILSAIVITVTLMLALTHSGIIEASTILRHLVPLTNPD